MADRWSHLETAVINERQVFLILVLALPGLHPRRPAVVRTVPNGSPSGVWLGDSKLGSSKLFAKLR
jgi:hypothetical protein